MRTFLILLFSLALHKASAQWFVGVKAGTVLANYKSPTYFKSAYKQGLLFGVTASKKINYDFEVQINAEYVQKGYYHYVCNTIYEKFETTFIQFPVLLGYNVPLADKLKLHLKAGGYGAWWLSGRYKTSGFNPSDDNFDFSAREARRFDFGPVAGAEIEYLLLNGNLFGLEFRYDLGLQDMETSVDSGTNTNRMMYLGAHYKFILQN
jgi:hypothetical protein